MSNVSRWTQLRWDGPREVGMESITWMELLPIVLSCAAWGGFWQGQRVIVNCDNTGAVAGNSRGATEHRGSCTYCGAFSLSELCINYQYVCAIEGTDNTWADAISRNYLVLIDSQVFKSLANKPLYRKVSYPYRGGAAGLDVRSLDRPVQELLTAGLAGYYKVYKTIQ